MAPTAPELALSTSLLPASSLPDGLVFFADAGISSIEIHGYTRDDFDFGDADLVAATNETVDRYGLHIWSCHSPAYDPLDLASTDPTLREHTCNVMRAAIRASKLLKSRVFVCDGVAPPRRDDAPSVRRAMYANSLRELLGEAKQLGLRLAIENHTDEWGFFVTPEDFFGLIATDDLAELGACWDTGHAWIAGQRPEAGGRLGTHLITLHVHDNDGRNDDHCLPLSGTIAWDGFLKGLRTARYEGPLMMELVTPETATSEAIRRLMTGAVDAHRRLIGRRKPAKQKRGARP